MLREYAATGTKVANTIGNLTTLVLALDKVGYFGEGDEFAWDNASDIHASAFPAAARHARGGGSSLGEKRDDALSELDQHLALCPAAAEPAAGAPPPIDTVLWTDGGVRARAAIIAAALEAAWRSLASTPQPSRR